MQMNRAKSRRKPVLREPKPGEWIEPAEFANVIRLTPLVAIDLIVWSNDGCILLGRRTNEPARDFLFVPGSRISKNETRAAAFRRITREELGVEVGIERARLLGAYDHIYPTNRFNQRGFGTHYVTLAYELSLNLDMAALPKDQHAEYHWLTPRELLRSPDVHQNTKAYFTAGPAAPGPVTSPTPGQPTCTSRR
jgi:colanic acid biosynthesis protein WcaH